jgi:hypothetical protein
LSVSGCWWGGLREGDHWGDPDVDGRIILRWIFRKWEGIVGTCPQTPLKHTITTNEPFDVISIKHRMVLPEDGSYMTRNMLE